MGARKSTRPPKKKVDNVLDVIDKTIEIIEKDEKEVVNLPKIPTREEILNLYIAFNKTVILP